jgi:uncharacterized protein YbbC (DUF1343 family)
MKDNLHSVRNETCYKSIFDLIIFAVHKSDMVKTGLEVFLEKVPSKVKGKRVGVLCHAPSITSGFRHITEVFHEVGDFTLSAIFGPQHGLYGQTQDNMIEWEGDLHPLYKIPVFSLYGEHRKPTPVMLNHIDALIVDMQDVGARLYTYVWTVKLCIEACTEAGIPVWILDRPNPVAAMWYDGPVLKKEFFTFVGGASIPLCHRMTVAEIALMVREEYYRGCELEIVKMRNWNRGMMFDQTGLPWVLPSPNMPTLQSAVVYPGMVLFEALNISEGRGTTIPFELFGAPFIDPYALIINLEGRKIPGCKFRIHNFIPTFHKFEGNICNGLQVHVTDIKKYRPVAAAFEIIAAIIETSPAGSLKFNLPPYEYETKLIPFDILSGDDLMRRSLMSGNNAVDEKARWETEIELFRMQFRQFSIYGDC